MLGIYHEAQRESLRVVCGVEKNIEKNTERRSMYCIQIMMGSTLAILSYSYAGA